MMCEWNPTLTKLKEDSKGIAEKRRDFTTFTKEISAKTTNSLFNIEKHVMKDLIEDCKNVAIHAVEDLLNNRVPSEKLTVSKSLTDQYKMRTKNEMANKKIRSFGPHNIFVGDLITLKKKKRKRTNDDKVIEWKVVSLGANNLFGNKIHLQREAIGDADVKTVLDKFILYNEIASRVGKMVSFNYIVNPNTPDREIITITQAHLRVARKMFKRDPKNAPKAGDRMDMLFCKVDDESLLQYERAEDPSWAKKNNMVPDPKYICDKQLKNAIGQTLDTVCPGLAAKLFDDCDARYKMTSSGQQSITNSFENVVLNTSSEIKLGLDRKILKKSQSKRRKKIIVKCKTEMFTRLKRSDKTKEDLLKNYVVEKKKEKPRKKKKKDLRNYFQKK